MKSLRLKGNIYRYIGVCGILLLTLPVYAQNTHSTFSDNQYVSLKANKGNVRQGPGQKYKIKWVLQHKGIPLRVIRTNRTGDWLQVADPEEFSGWMNKLVLSSKRRIFIQNAHTPLHRKPNNNALIVAYAEKGVIADLKECHQKWCSIELEQNTFWVIKTHIWGID